MPLIRSPFRVLKGFSSSSRFAWLPILAFSCLAPLGQPQTAPNLTGMSPGYGPQGTAVTFAGQGFGATQGSSTITLGSYAMTPTSWSDTQIVAPVPSNAPNGKYYPVITIGGLQNPSSAGPFTVGNPPVLTGMSPGYGPQGTAITFTGQGFGATQGSSTVTLGTYAMTPTSWSDTQIVAPVPSSAPNGKYYPVITVGGLQNPSSAGPFTVGNPPIITGLLPASGSPGTPVTITGVHFGATQGTSLLEFGTYTATPTSWSDTQIVVPVPNGIPLGKVYPDAVVGGLDTYTSSPFTVTQPPPAISALSPAAGAVGASVTISGSGFGATQGSSTVTLNGTSATPSSWSDTSIVVTVPSGATTGNIVVTVNGLSSNGANFTVLAVSIASLTPASAPVGASVTITGSGFGTIQQDVSTVSFNGTTAVAISWSDAKVVAVVSNGTTSGPVSVTVGGVTSNSLNFTVTAPPSITSVSPNTGAAGAQVSITGSGFGSVQGSGTVQVGSKAGTVVSWSDTSVVATVATGSVSGTAQVRQSGVGSNSVAFTVVTATITSVSPTSGPAGTQVTISGSGFGSLQGAGQVWLGTAAAQVSSWGDSQVAATVASGSNSGTAQILQNGVWSNSVAFTVTGGAPHITSINPSTGSAGTVVTIQGTGFGSSQGSGIAWIAASQASVNSWSDTQVSATVGSSAVSGVAKIQQNGLWSNAVTFTVPVNSGGSQLTLNPNVINMLVGDTRLIQALGSNSQPVTGLTWTSSDSTIVTLSTDDPPVITSVAPGNATITAGSASADVTVYSGSALPVGTVIWSNPGDGSGVRSISPAVPSPTGVADVFALQGDGTFQAITSDGAVAWATALPNTDNYPIPDFQGGAITTDTKSVFRFDGLTGQLSTVYTPPFDVPNEVNILGVHTDGTIFATELTCSGNVNQDASVCTSPNATSNNATGLLIVGLDPGTGTAKFKVPTDLITVDGSTSDASFCPVGPTTVPPETPSSSIAGDGYAYFVYYTFHEFDRLSPAAVLPYPKQAYLDLDLLYQDTANSNFSAAIGDQQALWGDLQRGAVPPDDRLLMALQAGDQYTALNIETGLPPGLGHPCSSSTTFTTQVHFLRVGTKGDSSDVVVKQWTETEQKVALPTVNYPFDHTTTRSGAMPALDWAYVITDSDQGAVVSWTIGTDNYCAQETVSNGQSACAAYVDTRFESHLTTMTGRSIAADAAWGDDRFIQPVLQLSDGSFVGNYNDGMANFDAAGNVKWTVPGYSPQMATADGSVIASNGGNATTFDAATGVATGQLPSFPQFQSWVGNSYNSGPVEQLFAPGPNAAATFAAFQGGNASANGTAIQQVQTNQPQHLAKQLPNLVPPVSCLLTPGSGVVVPTCGNVNAIELLTNQSADTVFKQYVLTFAPAADTPQKPNSIMFFDDPQNPGAPINVTAAGQVLQITLRGLNGSLQNPFSVQTERVDLTNDVLSVVTLEGHPLAGWRYWRVYSIGTTSDGKNDMVIETGAYDQPGPGPKNYAGYYISRGDIAGGWAQYLRFIQQALKAPQGSNLHNTLGGTQIINYFPNQWEPRTLIDGYWDYAGSLTNYILNNVCQSTTCN
jgi:hypothetical protein